MRDSVSPAHRGPVRRRPAIRPQRNRVGPCTTQEIPDSTAGRTPDSGVSRRPFLRCARVTADRTPTTMGAMWIPDRAGRGARSGARDRARSRPRAGVDQRDRRPHVPHRRRAVHQVRPAQWRDLRSRPRRSAWRGRRRHTRAARSELGGDAARVARDGRSPTSAVVPRWVAQPGGRPVRSAQASRLLHDGCGSPSAVRVERVLAACECERRGIRVPDELREAPPRRPVVRVPRRRVQPEHADFGDDGPGPRDVDLGRDSGREIAGPTRRGGDEHRVELRRAVV